MRGLRYIVLLLATIFISCRSERTQPDTESIFEPRYAEGFSIERDKTDGRLYLRVTNPWQGAKDVAIYSPIDKPAQRIVAMSSSYVAMLDAIGCSDHIAGVSGARFISTPSVAEQIAQGRVCEVGFDGTFDFERIRAIGADLILLYGVAGEAKMLSNRLDDLDIHYIYIGDYLETEPLGRAEWVIALAYLCGKEEAGKRLFAEIEGRYIATRDAIDSTTSRPRVMLNTPYRDSWFMPPTKSYAIRLIEDAGGEYIYEGNNSTISKPISLEEALLLARKADFWLNVGQIASLDELRRSVPHFAEIDAVRNHRVYNNTRRTTPNGGSDFWESGAIRPDIILSDLVKILHSEAKSEELYYYEQLQ